VTAGHRARYEAFVAKFCPLDDGKAGARACDAIFGV
jgi:CDP-glycerol glycerophosphotransferase